MLNRTKLSAVDTNKIFDWTSSHWWSFWFLSRFRINFALVCNAMETEFVTKCIWNYFCLINFYAWQFTNLWFWVFTLCDAHHQIGKVNGSVNKANEWNVFRWECCYWKNLCIELSNSWKAKEENSIRCTVEFGGAYTKYSALANSIKWHKLTLQ